MKINLSQTELHIIEQLIQERIDFWERQPCAEGNEYEEDARPYKKVLNKLQKIGG